MPGQPAEPPEDQPTEEELVDVGRVVEVYAEAIRTVLQEQIDEVAEGLRKQIKEALEEHRRTPHVGGQRVDDLEHVMEDTLQQLTDLVGGFQRVKNWQGRP